MTTTFGPFRFQLCVGLFLLLAHSLHAIDVPQAQGRGESEEAAIRQAAENALDQAVNRLSLEATANDRDKIISDYGRYFQSRRNLKTRRDGTVFIVVADFSLDEGQLRAALLKDAATKASRALNEPLLTIALVPRSPQGTVLSSSDEQALADALNASLGQLFSKYRFRITSPNWLLPLHDALKGHPDNIEKFKQNVRNLAKSNADTDYVMLGTAIVDIKAHGSDTDVSVTIEAEILDARSETNFTLPLLAQGAFRAGQERVAMVSACAEVAERIGNTKAVPALVEDWNDQVERGQVSIIHLFYDNDEFLEYIITALEDKGELPDVVNLSSNLLRLRYRSPVLAKKDFSGPFFLKRKLRDWQKTPEGSRPEALPFFCAVSPSDIVISPDTPEYRAMASAIIENRKYEVIDLPEIPAPLKENKASPGPVDPDPDTALAMVAKNYAGAVALVLYGDYRATAWAIAPNMFATNAHVAKPVLAELKAGRPAFLFPNRTKNVRLRVIAATYDRRFDQTGDYDVGLLKIEGTVEHYFPLASNETLQNLDSGERIAYLGFPAGSGGNVNIDSPVASMQTGIIVAVTAPDFSDAGASNNNFIRHSAPSFGGASGSALFNTKGEVIGVHSAGMGDKYVKLMTNLGWRVDVLKRLIETNGNEVGLR